MDKQWITYPPEFADDVPNAPKKTRDPYIIQLAPTMIWVHGQQQEAVLYI